MAEGGSTIPQQVAAIYFPLRWTGLRGKIAEAAVGSWLSVRYTRSKILELYLNRVFLSRCYGVDCAARSIFGKGPEQLGPSEVALLAKMLPGPAGRDPARNPGRADQARCLGLEVLAKKGVVSAFEADQGCRTRPVTYDPKVTVPAAVRRMIGAESGCGLASVGVVASGIDRKILSDLIRLAARFTDGRHQFDGVAVDRAGRLIGAVGKPDERGPIWSLVKPISTMIAVDAGLATLDQSIGSTLRGPYGVSEARWIATLTPCDRMRGLGRGLGWSDNCGGVGAFDLIRGIYRKRFAAFGLVVPGAELANGLGVAVQANLFEIAGAYTALVRPAVPAAHVSRGCGRVLPAPVRESTARGVFKALEATVRTGTAASAAAAWPNRSVPVAAKTGTGPREHLIAMVTKDIVVVLRVRSNRRLGGTAGSNLAPAAMGLIRRWYVRS